MIKVDSGDRIPTPFPSSHLCGPSSLWVGTRCTSDSSTSGNGRGRSIQNKAAGGDGRGWYAVCWDDVSHSSFQEPELSVRKIFKQCPLDHRCLRHVTRADRGEVPRGEVYMAPMPEIDCVPVGSKGLEKAAHQRGPDGMPPPSAGGAAGTNGMRHAIGRSGGHAGSNVVLPVAQCLPADVGCTSRTARLFSTSKPAPPKTARDAERLNLQQLPMRSTAAGLGMGNGALDLSAVGLS